MELQNQKKWNEYGSELTGAFSELMNFEKSFKPELEKKIREYDDLDAQAEKLTAKLATATDALEKKKLAIFAGLQQDAVEIRSARPVAKTPTSRNAPAPENIEVAIAEKLIGKARSGAAEIHSHGFACLKLERDLAAVQVEKFQLSEFPFQQRQQAARKFFLSLIQVAGVNINYQTTASSIGETAAWSAKLADVNQRIGIMQRKMENFKRFSYITDSADGVLGMAAMLPKEALPGLLEAWAAATVENAKRVKLTFDRNRSLRWFITKQKREAPDILTTHDAAFDVSSASDRPRYSTARQRASD
jgi:hypothetical protein